MSKLSRVLLRRGGEGRRACNYVSGDFNFTLNSPVAPHRLSCQISANQRKAEMDKNVSKHWKTRNKHNDVIADVIPTNQHFAWTFSMQIFKFQRCSCKLSFLFPPCLPYLQSAQRACSQAKWKPGQSPANIFIGMCDMQTVQVAL